MIKHMAIPFNDKKHLNNAIESLFSYIRATKNPVSILVDQKDTEITVLAEYSEFKRLIIDGFHFYLHKIKATDRELTRYELCTKWECEL